MIFSLSLCKPSMPNLPTLFSYKKNLEWKLKRSPEDSKASITANINDHYTYQWISQCI